MRFTTALTTVVLGFTVVLTVVACSGTSSGGGGGGGGNGAGGGGSCDTACGHYLACKGQDTESTRATCNKQCATNGYTQQQLSDYVQTDCATAVCTLENTCGGTSGTSGGTTSSSGASGGSSGTSAADCKGCVWDGSTCIYLTGSGGNYFACSASCCPGH